MIDFTVYIIEVMGGFCAIYCGIKLFINRKVNKFHKSIALNAIVMNVLYMIINFMWQSGVFNNIDGYSVKTLDYWLWTIW